MDQNYTFSFPTLIHFGPGVSKKLQQHLLDQGIRSPLIVTDPNIVNLSFFKELIQTINNGIVYDGVLPVPTKQSVVKGRNLFQQHSCDAVIGLGAGTAIDTARAIAVSIHHPGDLFDYAVNCGGEAKISQPIPYFITIPTACGTGSELSRSCEIAEDESLRKVSLFSPRLLAKAVFADPVLLLELPSIITASTGIVALSNNIEAFMVDTFHPMCDGIALEGVRLIFENLFNAVKYQDRDAYAKMMMAAMMGAVAMQKGQGIIHSASHSVSMLCKTPYGIANAVMLPYGLEYSIPKSHKKLQRLSDTIWSHDFIRSTKELAESLELPGKLSDLGVLEQDLEKLSELAFKTPYHSYNPRSVRQKDFLNLYKKAL